MVSDDDVFYYVGIDVFVYMCFLWFGVKIFLVMMLYGIVVFLFLNYFGYGVLYGLDRIVMFNVVFGLFKFWVYVILVWFYIVIICYFLYEEWKIYIIYC